MNKLKNRNTCNLCNHNEFELYVTIPKLGRKILKCKNCGLIFVDPLSGSFATFDFENQKHREQKYHQMRLAAEKEGKFDEDMIRCEEAIRTLHFKNRKEEIERYVKSGKLLDIGCGRGFFLTNFVGSNVDYFGIEPRRRISEEAQKRVGENKIFCGTLKEANLPDSHFDIVTMINLIEHLPFPKETLNEVNRIMKNSGLLLIETPNVESMVPKILGKRWHAFLEYEHHYFFSKDTLTRMLKDTGFRVEKMRRGNKLFSIRYLLYRLSWYNRKMSTCMEKILNISNLLEKTVKIPQVDELIVIARKVTTLEKG
jgi:2-polyprenyl-3-methyl-5-hydroxy-6-metoxy-1,4-benzoquinol methylase